MDRYEFLRSLEAEVSGGELVFSTGAQVAQRLQHDLEDPDCPVDRVTRLIQAEPLLSSRVVALANSVAFNPGARAISDVRGAVARVGFRNLRSLAAAVVTRQLGGARSPEHAELANRLWEHTAHVAALAQVIARRLTHEDPETAMFAGIVHEVAGFYLISRMKDFSDLLEQGGWAEWADGGEAMLGRAVLKVLEVPDGVVAAIEHVWQGYLALPPQTLGDTLLLADQLSPLPSPLRAPPGAASAGPPASIDMLIGEHTLSEILRESAEEVASLTDALRL